MKMRSVLSSAAITAALAHGSMAFAAAIDFDVGFVTLQDISISQVSSLSFGQNVFGTADSTCTVTPTLATGTDTGAVADADVTDGISGAGCLSVSTGTSNNFSGIYVVTGEPGQSINLTIASVDGTDFDFSPTVIAVDDTATYSTASSIPQDSPTAITLDSTSGNLNLVIGGTITIGSTTLTPNTSYTEQFTITATY
ncbi:hypothetical protein C2869_12785 [Saccharobesus litoralis]|uniref:DUF4402 domain-containing protein n=1 Tax=Saccharobesus litoralis TaxID=2172099 RepID=A0A2S0VSS1_9ALTE|nr:hypothetical protein [Saccharobesus litoralis]AWB67261.1 hypothetical protein C2869_12785 [Saccharobesus litoralis]